MDTIFDEMQELNTRIDASVGEDDFFDDERDEILGESAQSSGNIMKIFSFSFDARVTIVLKD